MLKKLKLTALFCASQIICLAQNNLSSFENSTFCGFSEDNVIFSSRDGGASWTELDFNKEYDGFYPEIELIAAAAGLNSMAVVGKDKEGRAHLFVSAEGKVWVERELSWLEHGSPSFLTSEVLELLYDPPRDQFLINCSDSTTLILPPCSHCNQLVETSVVPFLLGE
ncbi:MAG: hypothetical protein MJY89_04915 [Bacteroidales bacterium]|nr:hypothetical protein [Bacteroidales bacterium]